MTNTKFAKKENEQIVFAQDFIQTETQTIVNPTKEQYLANGYQEVEYTEKPDGDFYSQIVEIDGKITQVWCEIESEVGE